MNNQIRVLVVDDTAFIRHRVTKYLQEDSMLVVVGTAVDGEHALTQAKALRPDVIVLDVEMPNMDGLTALNRIMSEVPTPVIMLSTATTHRAAKTTIRALMRGAFDFVPKPSNRAELVTVMGMLREKIKIAAGARPLSEEIDGSHQERMVAVKSDGTPDWWQVTEPLIVIGTSTGGPRALMTLLTALPGDLEAAVLVVQHMPAMFTRSLAERLDRHCALTVREASRGERLAKGVALIAPGDYHMRLDRRRIGLDQGARVHHVRPAVDVTLKSAAAVAGEQVIAVILTGMGHDGTAGAMLVHQAGGRVVAEDETTSIVYGMPRSVVEAGLADYVRPLPDIASLLVNLVR